YQLRLGADLGLLFKLLELFIADARERGLDGAEVKVMDPMHLVTGLDAVSDAVDGLGQPLVDFPRMRFDWRGAGFGAWYAERGVLVQLGFHLASPYTLYVI